VDVFVESSVIWAFVGPERLEPSHKVCVALFEREDLRRHTSRTVEGEVRNSERQRNRLYGRLVAHLREGKKPEEFPVNDFPRHVAERARALVRMIRRAEADTEYFRRWVQTEAARVRDAFGRVEQPLISATTDLYFRDLVQSALQLTAKDAWILTDFLLWTGAKEAFFLTLDGALRQAVSDRLDRFLGDQSIVRPESVDYPRSKCCLTPERFAAEHPP